MTATTKKMPAINLTATQLRRFFAKTKWDKSGCLIWLASAEDCIFRKGVNSMGLTVSRKPGQSIVIGDNVRIEIMRISGNHVRLSIEAPSDISVHREEVFLAIQAESRGEDMEFVRQLLAIHGGDQAATVRAILNRDEQARPLWAESGDWSDGAERYFTAVVQSAAGWRRVGGDHEEEKEESGAVAVRAEACQSEEPDGEFVAEAVCRECAELATDVKHILSVPERREALRAVARENMDRICQP